MRWDEDGVFGDGCSFAVDLAPEDDGVDAVAVLVEEVGDVGGDGEVVVLDGPLGCGDPNCFIQIGNVGSNFAIEI